MRFFKITSFSNALPSFSNPSEKVIPSIHIIICYALVAAVHAEWYCIGKHETALYLLCGAMSWQLLPFCCRQVIWVVTVLGMVTPVEPDTRTRQRTARQQVKQGWSALLFAWLFMPFAHLLCIIYECDCLQLLINSMLSMALQIVRCWERLSLSAQRICSLFSDGLLMELYQCYIISGKSYCVHKFKYTFCCAVCLQDMIAFMM